MKIQEIEPKIVWRYFEEITRVPRPSKKEEKIRQYLRTFAADNSLPIKEDESGNIVITRAAAAGFEGQSAIILQSHVDMVCEKEAGLEFDFENDPIEAYVDGDWVKAHGTTLGADCGIGMAMSMAALTDPSLQCAAIEALFTIDEEQGLTGAKNLAAGMLTGKTMINLDSEDEGEIYIGCAGGIDTIATFDAQWEAAPTVGYDYFRLSVGGLRGGHSGDDINKGLACAVKVLTRELMMLSADFGALLCEIDAGNLRNAIARDGSAVVAIRSGLSGAAIVAAAALAEDIRSEFGVTEPQMKIWIEPCSAAAKVIGQPKLLMALQAVPHGVFAMSQTMVGMVESSTNLASVKVVGDNIVVTTSQRSSVESAKRVVAQTVASVFRLAGAAVRHTDGYPGWSPNPHSALVERSAALYREMFGKEAAVKAIHAGLECGLLVAKYPQVDVISIGPTIRGAHSPQERIQIATVAMVWSYLKQLITK